MEEGGRVSEAAHAIGFRASHGLPNSTHNESLVCVGHPPEVHGITSLVRLNMNEAGLNKVKWCRQHRPALAKSGRAGHPQFWNRFFPGKQDEFGDRRNSPQFEATSGQTSHAVRRGARAFAFAAKVWGQERSLLAPQLHVINRLVSGKKTHTLAIVREIGVQQRIRKCRFLLLALASLK